MRRGTSPTCRVTVSFVRCGSLLREQSRVPMASPSVVAVCLGLHQAEATAFCRAVPCLREHNQKAKRGLMIDSAIASEPRLVVPLAGSFVGAVRLSATAKPSRPDRWRHMHDSGTKPRGNGAEPTTPSIFNALSPAIATLCQAYRHISGLSPSPFRNCGPPSRLFEGGKNQSTNSMTPDPDICPIPCTRPNINHHKFLGCL